MPGLDGVTRIARRILADDPDPVVRFRLLRDVLGVDPRDPELLAARRASVRSPWVAEIAAEQHPDGSWGRFHSADTKLTRRNATTEAAVARALQLGLDRGHPILRRGARYVLDVLPIAYPFPIRRRRTSAGRLG